MDCRGKRLAFCLLGLILAASLSLPGRPVYAHAPARQTIVVNVGVGARTRTFDLGSHNLLSAPHGWTSATYDDSAWNFAQPVPADVQAKILTALKTKASCQYWYGSQVGHNYLFRLDFNLPAGLGWVVSPVAASPAGVFSSSRRPSASLWVNGHNVHEYDGKLTEIRYRLDPLLRPGKNVIAIYWTGKGLSSGLCFGASVTVAMTAIVAPRSSSGVHVLFPTQSIRWLAQDPLPFAWQAYPYATTYLLQVWQVSTSGRPAQQRPFAASVVVSSYPVRARYRRTASRSLSLAHRRVSRRKPPHPMVARSDLHSDMKRGGFLALRTRLARSRV